MPPRQRANRAAEVVEDHLHTAVDTANQHLHAVANSAEQHLQTLSNHVLPTHDPTTSPAFAADALPSPQKVRGLPGAAKFFLLPVVAFSLSAIFYTFAAPFIDGGNLPAIYTSESAEKAAVAVAGRVGLLWAAWALNIDATSAFALVLQVRVPYYFLLYLFYDISVATIATSTFFDAASAALAFVLMGRARSVRTKKIAVSSADTQTRVISRTTVELSVLAAGVYALSLFTFARTYGPVLIISFFDEVPTLERVHSSDQFLLFLLCLPLGWATREFVLSAQPTRTDEIYPTRSLWSLDPVWSLAPNYLSPYNVRITRRTRTLVALLTIETASRTYTTIRGADVTGSLLWAGVWSVSVALVSGALAWATDGALEKSDEVEGPTTVFETGKDVVVAPKPVAARRAGGHSRKTSTVSP